MKRSSFLKSSLLAASLSAGSSFATTPIVADIEPTLTLPRGSIREMSGWIEVQNPNRVELWASARSFSSPLGYSVEVSSEPVLVKGGDRARITLRLSVTGDGLYHVAIPVNLLGADGSLVSRVEGTIDLEVRDGTYLVDKYENLFVRPVDQQLDEDDNEVFVFRAAPPRTDIPLSRDYALERWEIDDLSIITDGAVYESTPGSEGDEVQSPTLPLPPPRDSTLPRHVDPEDVKYTQSAVDERIQRALETGGKGVRQNGVKPTGLVSGMKGQGSFNYTGMDGLLHPAWGWRVYAYIDLGFISVSIAKTNVKANGSWSVNLPALPSGYPVHFAYEPRNIYFTLKNSAGSYYSFSSGAQHSTATNKTLNEYTQAAYLSNSDLVGLGEVHRDGMEFWESLKTKGEGIDPVPSKSISLHYPNTTEDCGRKDGKLWSCASTDGHIWIIPAHASGNVIKHELAHQLQYKFWDGKTPDDSSGTHKITDCYTTGLALSEGFADFMLVWSNLDRTQNGNTPWNVERPDLAGACTTKNLNELWVAGNFWDFYDSVTDGKDTIYYVHTGIVPKMYLNNGKHNSMSEYLSIFKSKASSNHQTIVSDIFTQNHQ
ncbi:hypothetical protein [Hyalangium versicolor]|uniref:hypothetical protein n=1 Tax=Hyalangium versicolor TaxID=2861190 RepID=UPI001CCFF3F6|nr:hypothetical protein [Hyalangium versicolor]